MSLQVRNGCWGVQELGGRGECQVQSRKEEHRDHSEQSEGPPTTRPYLYSILTGWDLQPFGEKTVLVA